MVVSKSAYRYLRGDHNRPLLPHRQLAPIRDMLVTLAELYRAQASMLDGDNRFLDAATALDAAADELRRVAS